MIKYQAIYYTKKSGWGVVGKIHMMGRGESLCGHIAPHFPSVKIGGITRTLEAFIKHLPKTCRTCAQLAMKEEGLTKDKRIYNRFD